MNTSDPQQIKIFIAYSRQDKKYLEGLNTHLIPLCRSNKNINIWDDGEIMPGTKWEEEIKNRLNNADIILLLVSAYSLASDYFYNEEMKDALERHQENEASVIPIILSDCGWGFTQLKDLQVLPTDGKPLNKWQHEEEAYNNLIIGISKSIGAVEKRREQEQYDYELMLHPEQDIGEEEQTKRILRYLTVGVMSVFSLLFLYSKKESIYKYFNPPIQETVVDKVKKQENSDNRQKYINSMLDAIMFEERGEYEQAIDIFNEIIKETNSVAATNGLRKCIAKKDEQRDIDRKYLDLVEKGISLLIAHKHEEAKIMYQKALELKADGGEAQQGIDICEEVKSKNKEIIEFLVGSRNMIYVDGNTFEMGCNENLEDLCMPDEKPLHKITVSDFMISKYEVTVEQWRAVMGEKPNNLHFENCDKCPVEKVSWYDAQNFIYRLNQLSYKKFRLPTEAEWEFAAKGGIRSKEYKYAGSNDIDSVAWYHGNSKKSQVVGLKSSNELGLYDMTGNVYEWCSDWYDKDYYKNSPTDNPIGKEKGVFRVVRGGSWGFGDDFCQVVNRYRLAPIDIYDGFGFRLAQSPDSPSQR